MYEHLVTKICLQIQISSKYTDSEEFTSLCLNAISVQKIGYVGVCSWNKTNIDMLHSTNIKGIEKKIYIS